MTWVFGIAEAVSGAYGAYTAAKQRYLASLTPEQKVAYLAKRAAERKRLRNEQDQLTLLAASREIRKAIERDRQAEAERLLSSPEAALAFELIARLGLSEPYAKQLLDLALALAYRPQKPSAPR